MRFPAAIQQLLNNALGSPCAIYVPKRGAPFTGLPGKAYVAVTRPLRVLEVPRNPDVVELVLDGTKLFRFPVIQIARRPIPKTDGLFPSRDYSIEQWAARAIDRRVLDEILLSSGRPHRSVAPLPLLGEFAPGPIPDYRAFSEANDEKDIFLVTPSNTDMESERLVRHELTFRIWRDKKLRSIALSVDRGCIISGFDDHYRDMHYGLAAAHIRPVWANGMDTISNICLMCHVYHDLFDRHAFTFSDDLEIIWSDDVDPSILHPRPLATNAARFGPRSNCEALVANIRWHREQFHRSSFEAQSLIALRRNSLPPSDQRTVGFGDLSAAVIMTLRN